MRVRKVLIHDRDAMHAEAERELTIACTQLPPHPSKTHRGKLFPPARAIATIDVRDSVILNIL